MVFVAPALVHAAFPASTLSAAIRAEDGIIGATYRAARVDNDDGVDKDLASAPDASLKAPSSVLVSRRSAAVCAWLLYDHDVGRATKLARRVIQALETTPAETAPLDRFERLYWEAWLRAEVLDDKSTALKLIGEAEPLKRDDPRIAWSKKIWGAAS